MLSNSTRKILPGARRWSEVMPFSACCLLTRAGPMTSKRIHQGVNVLEVQEE